MRLATIRTTDGNRAVRLAGEQLVGTGYSDVGSLLADPDGLAAAARAEGPTFDMGTADFAPVVPRPSKVICVGHNYANHIREMGRDLPTYPTLFTKFADSLIGAYDDIARPPETTALDWEVELAVVIGRRVRRASEAEAEAAIAGFTVMNDVSMRDWQFRTVEWTQGKIWEASTPLGPFLVTPDELPGGPRPELTVRTTVDDVVMQEDETSTLLFNPVDLVRYVSTVTSLHPGDVIATGTPAGVGHARTPQVYLEEGQLVVAEISGLGACRNVVTSTVR